MTIDIGHTITVSTPAWRELKIRSMNTGLSMRALIDKLLKVKEDEPT